MAAAAEESVNNSQISHDVAAQLVTNKVEVTGSSAEALDSLSEILHDIPKIEFKLKSPGPPVKFPLLSRNYVINESSEMDHDHGIYDNVAKTKSPLEVFHFPEPPKEPFPAHYTVVRPSNGDMDEYAQPYPSTKANHVMTAADNPFSPLSYKGPKVTEPLITDNPFDQKYSIISPSRYILTGCSVGQTPTF